MTAYVLRSRSKSLGTPTIHGAILCRLPLHKALSAITNSS